MLKHVPFILLIVLTFTCCNKNKDQKALTYWEAFQTSDSYKTTPCITRSALDRKRFIMQTEKGVYQSFHSTKTWIPWNCKFYYDNCDSIKLPYPVFFGPSDSLYFQVFDSVYNEKGERFYAYTFQENDDTWIVMAGLTYFATTSKNLLEKKYKGIYTKKYPLVHRGHFTNSSNHWWTVVIEEFWTNYLDIQIPKTKGQGFLRDQDLERFIDLVPQNAYELAWIADSVNIKKHLADTSIYYTTPGLELLISYPHIIE